MDLGVNVSVVCVWSVGLNGLAHCIVILFWTSDWMPCKAAEKLWTVNTTVNHSRAPRRVTKHSNIAKHRAATTSNQQWDTCSVTQGIYGATLQQCYGESARFVSCYGERWWFLRISFGFHWVLMVFVPCLVVSIRVLWFFLDARVAGQNLEVLGWWKTIPGVLGLVFFGDDPRLVHFRLSSACSMRDPPWGTHHHLRPYCLPWWFRATASLHQPAKLVEVHAGSKALEAQMVVKVPTVTWVYFRFLFFCCLIYF